MLDLELLLAPGDLEGFSSFLAHSEFQPVPGDGTLSHARRVLSDTRTQIGLFAEVLGAARSEQEAGLFARAQPMKVYGGSIYRLELEDALLMVCLEHARHGFEVPMLSFIDLRELLLGAPSMGRGLRSPVLRRPHHLGRPGRDPPLRRRGEPLSERWGSQAAANPWPAL